MGEWVRDHWNEIVSLEGNGDLDQAQFAGPCFGRNGQYWQQGEGVLWSVARPRRRPSSDSASRETSRTSGLPFFFRIGSVLGCSAVLLSLALHTISRMPGK